MNEEAACGQSGDQFESEDDCGDVNETESDDQSEGECEDEVLFIEYFFL